jgi:hypothetical protein
MSKLTFTNLRVNIEDSVHPIYLELTRGSGDKAEDVPFVKMPDLFIAAACVGAKENLYKELSNKKRDIFVADAFDQKMQVPVIISLAYKKTGNIEILSDPRAILNICECWANGGIYLIKEQVISGIGLRPLYRLLDLLKE